MSANPLSAAVLPPWLWRISPRWLLWVAVLALGTAVGVVAFAHQFTQGLVVTSMRTVGSGGASWGLYIAFDVVFIGVSFAGITVAALIRLFGLQTLKPLARMAELLTITALLLGAIVVIADLGRPLDGLLKLPRLARPSSPFFGTFTMVIGGYLFASLVYFFLSCRADAARCAQERTPLKLFYRLWASGFSGSEGEFARHHKTSFWLSLFILPLLVTAHSTLGFIFGIQGGRPGWFSNLQAPSFVVAAGASGIGVLIVIAAVLRKTHKLEGVIDLPAFRWLGTMTWILTVVVLYFIIAEELTASYAAAAHEREYAHMIIDGPYRHLFFLELASFGGAVAVLFLQFALNKTSIAWTVVGGLLVNVGAVVKRYLLVVPSQTHGMMMPWPEGHYAPSAVELGVVGGLISLGMLVYTVFVKIFPIIPVVAHPEGEHGEELLRAKEERTGLRTALALGTMVLGLGLGVVGFAISSRAFVKPYADPLIPFSPVMFIVGLMLTFGSAIVYEVVPAARRARSKPSAEPAHAEEPRTAASEAPVARAPATAAVVPLSPAASVVPLAPLMPLPATAAPAEPRAAEPAPGEGGTRGAES